MNTSHCILHKHETSDGDPCPHGCLVGRTQGHIQERTRHINRRKKPRDTGRALSFFSLGVFVSLVFFLLGDFLGLLGCFLLIFQGFSGFARSENSLVFSRFSLVFSKRPRKRRTGLGHPAGQTGVYRLVSQKFPVVYYTIFARTPAGCPRDTRTSRGFSENLCVFFLLCLFCSLAFAPVEIFSERSTARPQLELNFQRAQFGL